MGSGVSNCPRREDTKKSRNGILIGQFAQTQQFRTQGFLRIESTAVQRCPRKSTEFASGSKIVDENRGDMENSLVTQDSTHRGYC